MTLIETTASLTNEQLPAVRAVEKPDAWNLYFHDKHGMPEGWRWVTVSCAPEVAPEGWAKVEGAVCPAKANGLSEWRKRDKTTERTFFFRMADLRAFEAELATKAGVCPVCWGEGRTVASTGVSGKRYRRCGRCEGTGLPATGGAK